MKDEKADINPDSAPHSLRQRHRATRELPPSTKKPDPSPPHHTSTTPPPPPNRQDAQDVSPLRLQPGAGDTTVSKGAKPPQVNDGADSPEHRRTSPNTSPPGGDRRPARSPGVQRRTEGGGAPSPSPPCPPSPAPQSHRGSSRSARGGGPVALWGLVAQAVGS